MKGTALFKFVNSLSEEEYRLFKGLISAEKESELLLRMVAALSEMEKYEEKEFLKRVGISKSKKNELLKAIDTPVMTSLAASDPEGRLVNAYCTARNLVFKIENEPAIALMKWAFKESLRIERFDITLDLLDLADILTEPYPFEAPSVTELGRLQSNILDFRMLEARLREYIHARVSDQERAKILYEVKNSPLLYSADQANSKRALWYYYKIKAALFVFSGSPEASLRPQSDFVQLIKENEWLRSQNDFFLIKEMGQLLRMFFSAADLNAADSIIFQVGNISTSQPRAEKEKYSQLYPYRIYLALKEGNPELGMIAVDDVLELMDRDTLTNKFITDNLYYSAYLLFSIEKFSKSFKLVRRLKRFSRSNFSKDQLSNFSPNIYSMVKVLEILIAFETGTDDPIRLIKNFRKSNQYDQNLFFKILFGTITRVAGRTPKDHDSIWQKAFDKVIEIQPDSPPGMYFNYFDLPVWLASKLSKVSMAEEFRKLSTARRLNSSNS